MKLELVGIDMNRKFPGQIGQVCMYICNDGDVVGELEISSKNIRIDNAPLEIHEKVVELVKALPELEELLENFFKEKLGETFVVSK